MTTKLKVLNFDFKQLFSRCIVIATDDETIKVGDELRVDLTVDGGFGEMPEADLVGEVVTVDRFKPFVVIGVGVTK